MDLYIPDYNLYGIQFTENIYLTVIAGPGDKIKVSSDLSGKLKVECNDDTQKLYKIIDELNKQLSIITEAKKKEYITDFSKSKIEELPGFLGHLYFTDYFNLDNYKDVY